MATTVALTPRRFGALRYRDFVMLWAGLLVSNTGTWMQSVAQGWLVYQLTNSPFYLGLLGASSALPRIFLPMVGGTLADRYDRCAILKITQTIMLLAAAAMGTLALAGTINIWHIIVVSFISSVALAVDNPGRQALIPDLVPRHELLSAVSLNSVAFNGAALVGPSLAGLAMAAIGNDLAGSAVVFYLNALSFLAVLIPLFFIRPRPAARLAADSSIGGAIFEGLRYVYFHRSLLLLLILSAIVSMFGRSFSQLLPVFARDVLHVGERGLGLMFGLPGAGTLLAGFCLAAAGEQLNRRHLLVAGQLGLVAAIVGFALSRSFPLSLALLGVSGFCSTTIGTVISTVLQSETQSLLRGRVMSLNAITILGLGPLGSLISGSLATFIPAGEAIVLPALVILAFLALAVTRPAWREIG